MALLLEGMTLVFKNEALEANHPFGLKGFISDWDNGSFCTDGTISKISYFEVDDGFCVLTAMKDLGLNLSASYAEDVAVFLHGGQPWTPCLWLETEQHPNGYMTCWHVFNDEGRISVPAYFKRGKTLAGLQDLSMDDVYARILRIGIKDGIAMLKDETSGQILYGPKQICRH